MRGHPQRPDHQKTPRSQWEEGGGGDEDKNQTGEWKVSQDRRITGEECEERETGQHIASGLLLLLLRKEKQEPSHAVMVV
jgi:hypothetical protein